MEPKLIGRTAIVTGGTRGLGHAIATAFVSEGANVMIVGRHVETLGFATDTLRTSAKHGARVAWTHGDISDVNTADEIVERTIQQFGSCQILVNNAGVYGPFGSLDAFDFWTAWVGAIRTNLFGSALMMRALLPYLREQRYGKIIQISGGGATAPLPRITAYAASKAAVVRLAESVAADTVDDHIDVNSLAPGLLDTQMTHELLSTSPEIIGEKLHLTIQDACITDMTPLDLPARLAVFLASADSDGLTGKLISAPWDNWVEFMQHRSDPTWSNDFTLRRIVPDWGKC